MKNQDGWTAFRKKRFYENQRRKKEKQFDAEKFGIQKPEVPKTIAVMLDLEGTCDFINEEKAYLFIKN